MSRDALVVGINTYTYERLNNLTAPAQDAEAVAQLLEKYGDFKVRRLPAVKDKQNDTIRVGQKTKVTLTQLEDAIVQLFTPEGNPPDTALLYFSGHGLRKSKGRVQEGFLASSDVNPDDGKWGLSLQWLRRLLQESEVKQQIIILDCCYAGEVLNVAEADPGDRGKGRDRCFIAASRSFEVAYEEIGSNHSVLTAALIKGLEPKQQRWVTNYTLVDLLNQEQNAFPQRPIFANSGEAINLTRRWTAAIEDSAASAQAICPYKGLNYFDCTQEDAKYFYGRTTLTDELLEKVRVGNFLAVLGASGSGKSSVVRAGLLYQLQMGRRLSGSESWLLKIFQPGEHPLYSLAQAFLDPELSGIERATQLAKAEELIAKGSEGLRQIVAAADTQRVVLVVDQFEEAFTLCQDIPERQQFFECLLGALPKIGDKLCLVLTMRADFFGKCTEQEYSGLAQQIQQHGVPVMPMLPDDLRKAIVKPAKQAEIEIEPELVEQMLADVADAPGHLPLLQYTLTELWKQRTDNCLRLNTYAKLGGVMGTLRQRATQVYESFTEEEQAAVRYIFLALTQLGEGTEDTRRRVLKQDLVNQRFSEKLIDTVVQRLADEKLVVTSEMVAKGGVSKQVAVVDVAHEALIRNWTLLRQWIGENRDKLRQKRKIEAAAEEWRDRGKSKDYLLVGRQLGDAKAFQKQEAENFTLSNLAGDFIRKSIQQKRNNLLKLIGFGFIFPVALAIFLGVVGERQIRIKRYWDTVEAAKGQKESFNRISALQELVKLGVSLAKLPLTGADLRDANLRDANLEGADLSSAYLEGANLEGAKLRGANLSSANLSSANLEGANLRDANLRDANLEGANLYNAKLIKANLIKANLIKANLIKANLEGAKLRGANLEGAKLRGAKLIKANLSSANLSSANLEGANLYNAKLIKANLIKANLEGAKLRDANLEGADLSSADLSSADLWGANLSSAYLNYAYLSSAYLNYAYLRGAYLRGAYLRGAYLRDANLEGANLEGADLSSADLWGANLRGAKLIGTKLNNSLYNKQTLFPENFNPANQKMYLIAPGANLRDANLEGANLEGADLSSADLRDANLRGANLSSANLEGADLRDAKLIGTKLNNSLYNKQTLFPENFNPANQKMYLIAPGANLRDANLEGADLLGADLLGADLRDAKELTPQQVKSAKNWENAKYDKDFRTKLGLPPENP